MVDQSDQARGSERESDERDAAVDAAPIRPEDPALDGPGARDERGNLPALARLDRWLSSEYAISDESIGFFRVFCALAVVMHVENVAWVSRAPELLFLPHIGPMQFMTGVPSADVLTALR